MVNHLYRLSVTFIFVLSSCSVAGRNTDNAISSKMNADSTAVDGIHALQPSASKEQTVSVEPDIKEYKSLPGDHGHDERVDELFSEALAGNRNSLLLLGEADTGQEVIVKRLRENRNRISNDDGPDFVGYVLAKLGDHEERMRLENDLFSGIYTKEEGAISALEYVSDQWSNEMFIKGLSVPGGPRQVFVSDDKVAPENKAMAPPIRFKCVSALDELYPGSGVQSDIDLITDRDVELMKSWVANKTSK